MPVTLRRLTIPLLFAFAVSANAAEIVRVPPWEFHSSFWMSLHQTLIEDASRPKPRDEQAAWTEAVAAYKTTGRGAEIMSDRLSQVADDAAVLTIDSPLADALRRAAPIYRSRWWADDDRTNRFFISYASAMIREAGPDLVRAHEKVYRATWPSLVRAYITPYGGQFGAHTFTGQLGGVITIMSSRESGYQGLRALEMLLHESSHAVVFPNEGTLGIAIAAASKKRGIDPPRNLWHALLFATSGELTRRLLADRGSTDFVPSSVDMLTRVWPKYREAIEKHWVPYLGGRGTLEEAVDQVVEAMAR